MQAISDNYRKAYLGSAQNVVYKAALLQGGQIVFDDLRITEGSVRVDRTATVRRTCTLTLIDLPDNLIPTAHNRSPLDPYGNEIAISRGFKYPDGTSEYIPLGVFRIYQNDWELATGGTSLTLTGNDRAQSISDAKFTAPYTLPAGQNIIGCISDLVTSRIPGIVVNDLTQGQVTYTVPTQVYQEQTDPWATVQTIALAAGVEVFFDVRGILTIRPIPDVTKDAAVWSFEDGEQCTVTSVGRKYDITNTFNAVFVTGQSASNTGSAPSGSTDNSTTSTDNADTIIGRSYDLDPRSPTYWGDPASQVPGTAFGRKPYWQSNSLATTTAQCQAISDTLIRNMVGLSEQITANIIPHPALDVSDIAKVTLTQGSFHDNAIIESFTIPIGTGGGGDMQVTFKTRRISYAGSVLEDADTYGPD